MSFDLAVSRAVTMIHALEMAAHDSGPWSIELADMTVPARRTLGDYGVTFAAEFPHSAGGVATLRCRGFDILTSTEAVPASAGPFACSLELSLPAGVSA